MGECLRISKASLIVSLSLSLALAIIVVLSKICCFVGFILWSVIKWSLILPE